MPNAEAVLFPRLAKPDDGELLTIAGTTRSAREIAEAAATVATDLAEVERVAVWAEPRVETVIAVVGALASGTAVVPLNPNAGTGELEHIQSDSAPALLMTAADATIHPSLHMLEQHVVHLDGDGGPLPDRLGDEDIAIILYTSGTTGPPKGVMLPRRAIESNLDALAQVWQWTAEDRLAHGLPLFHVHGLVLGILGPLRRGGTVEHVGRFSPRALADAADRGATMFFGVPTMYHRIANEAEEHQDIARAFTRARLLVSGSAPLPATEHRRIERLTGQKIVERYGMTETLMNVSVRADGDRRPGYVGLPLPGVNLRLVNDDGSVIVDSDDETIGEVEIKGPNLFAGYLNRPDATTEAFRDGWFHTGDLATRHPDGYIRIVGRRSTDLIKTGGFKVAAGEIEAALLEHPAVAEAAVVGQPDADLGERVAAWIVPAAGADPAVDELQKHVAALLAPHKRPRDVHLVDSLPRNEMGKVMKRALRLSE